MLATLIQRYDKNYFIFYPVQEWKTNWIFTGCQMSRFMIVLVFFKTFLDNKMSSLVLRNMEPFRMKFFFHISAQNIDWFGAPIWTDLGLPVVFLLVVPVQFLSRDSFLYVRRWFRVWRLFCHYLFLISLSFDLSGKLCIMIVAFPGFMLFVLRSYGPVNPMGSCRARPLYLTTRLLGRLSPLSG